MIRPRRSAFFFLGLAGIMLFSRFFDPELVLHNGLLFLAGWGVGMALAWLLTRLAGLQPGERLTWERVGGDCTGGCCGMCRAMCWKTRRCWRWDCCSADSPWARRSWGWSLWICCWPSWRPAGFSQGWGSGGRPGTGCHWRRLYSSGPRSAAGGPKSLMTPPGVGAW